MIYIGVEERIQRGIPIGMSVCTAVDQELHRESGASHGDTEDAINLGAGNTGIRSGYTGSLAVLERRASRRWWRGDDRERH
jgi:hypothetical protein